MPTEVLNQLRVLRESIADTLRKDPRYLTLAALDKSIAEIAGVLSASGISVPDAPAAAPLKFDSTPAAALAANHPAPEQAAAFEPVPAAVPPVAVPVPAATPAAPEAQAAAPLPKGKKKKKSLLKPVLEGAAVLAAAGVAAEVVREMHGSSAPKTAETKPEAAEGDDTDDDPGAKAPSETEKADETDASSDAESADKDEGDETKTEDKPDEDKPADEKPDGDAADASNGAAGGSVIPEGKASGYVPMAAKPNAPQYQPAISVKFGKLPNKVDLRSLMTPVEDQGQTSSCVANAVAGAYEYWIKKALKQDQNISRLFVYYNARWRDGSQDKDDGSVIQLAMEGLSKFGACDEKVWPFDEHLILKKPGAEAYQDAAPFRVQDMAQVPLKLEAWKQALAEGKPIVFGVLLFDSFDECSKRGGVVPMPAPEDIARAKHSGHSMCAVGYSESEKVFIVRNSWGADWGDKGYCYMPYAYLMNPKFNDSDSWVFVPKVPSQPPREVWSDDTTPVTNDGKGVDFPIETYSVVDYERVAFDVWDKVRRPFNDTLARDFSEYVSFAGKGLWSQMENFDFRTFLASTVALTGISSLIASEFSSTAQASESTSLVSENSESSEESSADSEEHEDASDDESDDDSDEDSDDEDDDESDDEDSDDEDGDESDDEDGDAEDDESDEDEASDDEDDESSEDESDDEGSAEDSDEDDDADEESEDDEDDPDDDDDSEYEDDSEDDAGDDDDDGGDDDAGGDESGDDED